MLTHQRVTEVLEYVPDTGTFYWRKQLSSRGKVGSPAGYTRHDGYAVIKIDRQTFIASRLAWFYMKGVWPIEVDHKDNNPSNNRWHNLREATSTQNKINRTPIRPTSNLPKWVVKDGCTKSFRSRVRIDGKRITLGPFPTPEEAHKAAQVLSRAHYGEFVP